jgi:hypothetical protein
MKARSQLGARAAGRKKEKRLARAGEFFAGSKHAAKGEPTKSSEGDGVRLDHPGSMPGRRRVLGGAMAAVVNAGLAAGCGPRSGPEAGEQGPPNQLAAVGDVPQPGAGRLQKGLIGYMLAHEQFTLPQLMDIGTSAAGTGFGLLATSDHFQPWQVNEGHSGLAWVTLGALAPAPRTPGWAPR